MELVEGETLAERIGRGPMPLDDALPIARQIAEALEAAHEQGVIHRRRPDDRVFARGCLASCSCEWRAPEPVRSDRPFSELFEPVAIPGQQAVLARKGASIAARRQVVALSLSDGRERALGFGLSPQSLESDLLFVDNSTLWRVGFDAEHPALQGAPVAVLEDVAVTPTARAIF